MHKQQAIVRSYRFVPVEQPIELLQNGLHEDLLTFLLLVEQFERSKEGAQRQRLVGRYLDELD